MIVNFNFDTILEWYINSIGIKPFCKYEEGIIEENNDVEILHPHGFLPNGMINYFNNSKDIVFSWRDFDAFFGQSENYLNIELLNFFRTKCFLSIGVSPKTIECIIKKYISLLLERYRKDLIKRDIPFGFALIQKSECTSELINDFRNLLGIIVIEIEHPQIPDFILKIAKNEG